MKSDKPLTIGPLAQAAGVHVEAVRYYQRRGLIEEPHKPARGHRLYSAETLKRLLFIRRAQELGFTLEEIANLLALGEGHCREVQGMAERKLVSVRAKIADLRRLESVLGDLLSQCRRNPDDAHCPIVESLLPET